MNVLLRQYLWIGVIVAVAVGVIAAIWLAGVAAGPGVPGVPVVPPAYG
jgi:hypothetical protein